MPQTIPTVISVTSAIGSVVAPVGLIMTTAILLSGYTSKYSSISDQLHKLAAEYRAESGATPRGENIREQLRLYHRRITAMWAASTLLSLALLSFIVTVLIVLFSIRATHLGPVGVGTLLLGLVFVAAGVGLELYEISLARLTVAGELSDIFEGPKSTQV